ncbi:MAG: hypothetical protein Q9165_007432 [Trypethelium subeluteriae]
MLHENPGLQKVISGGWLPSGLDTQPPKTTKSDLHIDRTSFATKAALTPNGRASQIFHDAHVFQSLGDIIYIGAWYLIALYRSFFKGLAWSQIDTIFVFGDSYSSTEFDLKGAQPNPANPLGNPPYPGSTSSNGPNWVDFMTTTWNESYIRTYNLAVGGATVDSNLVAPFLPFIPSMKQQIEDRYLPIYGSSTKWNASSTLFAIWIGINDVGNSFANKNPTLNPEIFKVYSNLVDQLYVSGARRFLFLNVPPLDLTPRTVAEGPDAQATEKADITDFNHRLSKLTQNLTSTYSDAHAVQFDVHKLFSKILDNPTAIAETVGYKNVTDWCKHYENGTPKWDTFHPRCGVAVNEYLWLNNLHPTYPIHNATAHSIAAQLAHS